MKKFIFLLTLSLLSSGFARCQTGITPAKDSIFTDIVNQIALFPQEKLYLHTDKPLYISGETVWLRAFLVDAVLHKPLTNQYVIVELINPLDSVVNRIKIRPDRGAFSGYIPLNENLPEGDYTLYAYTEYMLNLGEDFFFKKNIRIHSPLSVTVNNNAVSRFEKDDRLTAKVSPKEDFDVSFYPEGGYLPDGVPCIVAFKSLNSAGMPEKVTVKIVDSNGIEYGQVETIHDGMGLFSMASKTGEKYFAVCTNEQNIEKRFELPQAQAELITDRQNYSSRQQVNTTVKITDANGVPQEGSFSVSVTDDNDIQPDSSTSIMTSLLLTSDLKGYINNPGYYFQGDHQEALDLLMLTNGWRRYNIPDVVKGKYETPHIPLKYGMEVKRRARSLIRGKPAAEALIGIFSWEAGYYEETITDINGRFLFNGFEFPDSSKFIVQALTKKGSNGVELLIDADVFPRLSGLPLNTSARIEDPKEEEQLSKYINKADTKYTIENGMRTVYIEEVVIKARAPEKKDYRFSYYMPKLSPNILTAEQIEAYQPMYISDILKYIPHVELVTDEFGMRKVKLGRTSYRLPGGPAYNYAALIIDDIIIHDYDIDNIIDPSDIERIGVLQGAQATLLGFQKPAEFYSPRYDTPEQSDNWQPDLRTTIYWNPNIVVSSPGEGNFDFYTADSKTTYTMIIEGVTSDGAVIQSRGKITLLPMTSSSGSLR
ncbi:MAG TPA: MG2 domain-containing protein [Bacteroidales bacterium]|nr:MG2 domain-containing protein [Bacteroidales bacterium]